MYRNVFIDITVIKKILAESSDIFNEKTCVAGVPDGMSVFRVESTEHNEKTILAYKLQYGRPDFFTSHIVRTDNGT